jgi:hypothetical protein
MTVKMDVFWVVASCILVQVNAVSEVPDAAITRAIGMHGAICQKTAILKCINDFGTSLIYKSSRKINSSKLSGQTYKQA